MNPLQVAAATGSTFMRALLYLAPLSDAMGEFDIRTPIRRAAFLSQVGHESGGLRYTREIWGPTPAQLRYEGRVDLGNVHPGDGKRYLGRGLIQITGRANYGAAGRALGLDLINRPELLEERDMAAAVSGWWWQSHGCNELADAGNTRALTLRINGGLNGLSDRLALYAKASKAFGVTA